MKGRGTKRNGRGKVREGVERGGERLKLKKTEGIERRVRGIGR